MKIINLFGFSKDSTFRRHHEAHREIYKNRVETDMPHEALWDWFVLQNKTFLEDTYTDLTLGKTKI